MKVDFLGVCISLLAREKVVALRSESYAVRFGY